jgi:two-component system response regulator MtrA
MSNPRILVVEDDPASSQLVIQILKSRDVSIEVADDGVAALESLRVTTPDLVILDLALPRVDGWEILNTLSQAQRYVPVIVITAHGQGSAAERALNGGAKRFFEKPFIPSELAEAVDELMAGEA